MPVTTTTPTTTPASRKIETTMCQPLNSKNSEICYLNGLHVKHLFRMYGIELLLIFLINLDFKLFMCTYSHSVMMLMSVCGFYL